MQQTNSKKLNSLENAVAHQVTVVSKLGIYVTGCQQLVSWRD
jgi:hypothetical protein